jgi:hypothetical protein
MYMMQNIKNNLQYGAAVCGLAGVILMGHCANAATPEGTWKFERSMDYYGRTPANKAPKFPSLVVRAKDISLSESCLVPYSPTDYAFPDVFQPLSKEGGTKKQLDSFLIKNFGVALGKVETVYSLGKSPGNCARSVLEFFQVGDRLLIPIGVTFYSYVKADPAKLAATTAAPIVEKTTNPYASYKVTPLPMNFDQYFADCRLKILGGKSRPQTTDKCAPNYFPYVADPKSNDMLMKLVGNHDYVKGGSEYAAGFSPPFVQKTAATFLVFPPLKQVTLVRVDDFEVVRNEKRDVMSGVYLSIVGNKVIDQISGCDFNRDYVCIEDGRPAAKLTENGRFRRL